MNMGTHILVIVFLLLGALVATYEQQEESEAQQCRNRGGYFEPVPDDNCTGTDENPCWHCVLDDRD